MTGRFKFQLWGVEIETESFLRDPSMTGTCGVLRIDCRPDAMMSRDVRNAAVAERSSHSRHPVTLAGRRYGDRRLGDARIAAL